MLSYKRVSYYLLTVECGISVTKYKMFKVKTPSGWPRMNDEIFPNPI